MDSLGEHNPLIRQIRRAVQRGTLTESGFAVAEGLHLVEDAVKAECEIRAVIVSEAAKPELIDLVSRTVELRQDPRQVSQKIFRTLSSTETPQGVLALVKPPAADLAKILAPLSGRSALLVILDGVQDPGNAGAIIRVAEAFGASGAIFLKGSVDPFHPRVLRGSAGSCFRLPILAGVEAQAILDTPIATLPIAALPISALPIYAAMPRAESSVSIESADFTKPCAIAIGGEGHGVRAALRARSTPVHIPTEHVESLNAAVAAGIFLYEARRQRGARRGRPMSLFDLTPPGGESQPENDAHRPLAERMRPDRWEDFAGQQHILGPGKPLRAQIERDELQSLILWGPPGVGKTTLARLIARITKCDFVPFSAVLSGIKEIKAVMADAERAHRLGRRTVLFVDEIHRFNKAQQDAFLPYVERGDIILIGATTENPSFEVVSALLSRAKVYALKALEPEEIVGLLERALKVLGLYADRDLLEQIAVYSNGDARAAYNVLELAASVADRATDGGTITREAVEAAMGRKTLLYDKSGEEHFNLISALHKSVRSSDPDAALYWLARMLEGGEDRMYLARRLVRMAVEDIGLADPRALEQAMAAQQAVHFLGVPEGDQALAQIAIYLAVAPKSDAAYRALNAARETIAKSPADPVPMQLRNAPTRSMKEWGYGEGYQHAHQFEDALNTMECLPDRLRGTIFYEPTERGIEQRISQRLKEIREQRQPPPTPKS